MENKRKEYTVGMESKIEEMATTLVAVQDKFEELEDVKASGAEAVAELQAKRASLKEEIQLATDLGTAKYLMQQIEELEQDVELQNAINNGKAVIVTGELEELFKAFYAVQASAKTIFNVLDKEYVQTMSIRTLEDDTATMDSFAHTLNGCFGTANALLLEAGLVESGAKFYGSVHLGQMNLLSQGGALKREMKHLQRQLSI
jgi:predicted nuclease with TOPRIM domain